nr:MAG: murein biosynthesis integral membrane protein MurJ [Caldicoprobacter oshimai]
MEQRVSYKKATMMVIIITLISKVTGFLREIFLGSAYGATYVTDAYLVSLTIPQTLFSSIAAAITTTFIPLYSSIGVEGGRGEDVRFTNRVLNVVLVTSGTLAVLGMVFARPIVSLIARGFEGEALEMATAFTRITFPMIVFIGICQVFIGYLQANGEFALPALIGIPSNAVVIAMLLLSGGVGPYGLVLGTLAGAVIQAAMLLIGAYKRGYSYTGELNFRDPYVSKVIALALPVMMGSAVQQINVLIDRRLASGLPEGSISALNFANKLNGFAYGLFTISLATVIYPLLSRLSAEKDMAGFKEKLVKALNVITLIILPITVGAIVLRRPIVSVLFERGQFDARATSMTASALMFYSLGMVFYGYRDVLNKTFYSLQDTKTPMINGMLTVALNIMLNLILVKFMQHDGLALATSLSAMVMTVLLFANLRKRLRGIAGRKLVAGFLKCGVASLIMGLAVYWLNGFAEEHIHSSSGLIDLLVLGAVIMIGAALYFALVYVFKVEEVDWLVDMVKKRMKASR